MITSWLLTTKGSLPLQLIQINVLTLALFQIASQYSMQAAEANRQLAEYLIRNGTVNQIKAKPYTQPPVDEHMTSIPNG